MGDFLDVTQLFAVGLGFDIAGAYMLARGLLTSNDEIARRTATYLGSNPWATVSEVSDRADAKIGVAALIGGFAVQGGAYVATLATDVDTAANVRKAVVAVIVGAVAIAAVLVAARVVRRRLVYPALIEIASIDEQMIDRLPYPHGGRLQSFAQALGFRLEPPEDGLAFVQRVFSVEDAMYGDAPNLQRGSELRRQREAPTAES